MKSIKVIFFYYSVFLLTPQGIFDFQVLDWHFIRYIIMYMYYSIIKKKFALFLEFQIYFFQKKQNKTNNNNPNGPVSFTCSLTSYMFHGKIKHTFWSVVQEKNSKLFAILLPYLKKMYSWRWAIQGNKGLC